MRKALLVLSIFIITLQATSQNWGTQFSNAIITRYQPNINSMTNKGWEYSNGIVLHGIEKIYYQTHDIRYLNYIQVYLDAFISPTGVVTGLDASLDKIEPAMLCLFMYQQTGMVKYKTAAANIRNYLLGANSPFGKTPDGGYWHKNNGGYNNVMMLDGIYMAHPFLAKYGRMFNDTTCLNVAAFQTMLLASHCYDSTLHLAYHAYNSDHTEAWANPVTGASSEVWSRAMGWYAMAVVDILRYLPATHPRYADMRSLLGNLAIGRQATQDSATGLWYQVMDKGGMAGNYLESSGSGMLVYAIKTAVDSGWISPEYITVAQKGWAGMQTKIGIYTDGLPEIDQFAPAMSVLNNYAAYVALLPVNCPSTGLVQHPHGYCGLLMAASAMQTVQPVACPGGSLFFTSGYGTALTYQWQVNTGAGFTDFPADDEIYSGTHTDTLRLTKPPTSWYGYKYQCVLTDTLPIKDNGYYTLKFENRWTGATSTAWENPANWQCGELPDANTDAVIPAKLGRYPVVNASTSCRSVRASNKTTVTVKPGVELSLTGKAD